MPEPGRPSELHTPTSVDGVEVTRAEEQATITRYWHPYRRVRITKQVVTERRTIEVDVRREELFIEELDLADPAEGSTSDVQDPAGRPPAVIVLRGEQIEVTRTMVPYERAIITVARVEEDLDVVVDLVQERVDLDRTDRPTP